MEENMKNEAGMENMEPISEMNEKPKRGYYYNTDLVEKIMSVVILALSYVYSMMMTTDGPEPMKVYLIVFIIGFYAFSEIMYFKRKRTFETWVFLGLSIALTVAYAFDLSSVWETGSIIFFIHLFAVYYVLVRSGRLAEGKTSHLFLWDGITGFFVMPFKNIPALLLTIISCFRGNKGKRKSGAKVWIIILSVVVGLILLFIANWNLMLADAAYSDVINQGLEYFHFEWDPIIIIRLILTFFIAFYLYGIFGGCYAETEAQVQHRGDNIKKAIGFLKRVPNVVWLIFIGIASIFYFLFFGLQGTYLWGAFTGSLPEGFIYSSYAREGFFNMCMVMAINLSLDWLLSRTSEKENKSILVGRLILAGESILFSVIALLKLMMYIDVYGFTPLRFQSLWLIIVLLLGCILTAVSAISKKKTARIWFIASASLLVLFAFLFPGWSENMVIVNGFYF